MPNQQLIFVSFGVSKVIWPTGLEFAHKIIRVDPEDIVPLIPGFVAGASLGTFYISRVLRKIGCRWKIRLIERISEKRWRYTFEIPNSEWKVQMVVTPNKKKWEQLYDKQTIIKGYK